MCAGPALRGDSSYVTARFQYTGSYGNYAGSGIVPIGSNVEESKYPTDPRDEAEEFDSKRKAKQEPVSAATVLDQAQPKRVPKHLGARPRQSHQVRIGMCEKGQDAHVFKRWKRSRPDGTRMEESSSGRKRGHSTAATRRRIDGQCVMHKYHCVNDNIIAVKIAWTVAADKRSCLLQGHLSKCWLERHPKDFSSLQAPLNAGHLGAYKNGRILD